MDRLSAAKENQVKTGEWGGEHIALRVDENGAEIDYDSARGRINQPITTDKDGKFDLKGTYVPERGGPVRIDQPFNAHSANYAGIVKDKSMTLTVTLSDTKEVVGTFDLTYGSPPQVMKSR
jgi:hypothetical protein